MKVFCHHIYEYQKGLRNLILHTMNISFREPVITKLNHYKIDFVIHEVGKDKINIYFGDSRCVDIVKSFNKPYLSELDDKEDFMLGVMLGYSMLQQCERYLKRLEKPNQIEELAG